MQLASCALRCGFLPTEAHQPRTNGEGCGLLPIAEVREAVAGAYGLTPDERPRGSDVAQTFRVASASC